MSAAGSDTYYCGWAITGRTMISHLVSAPRFPIAGSRHRSWCGQTITVIALTLNVRRLPGSCPDCTATSARCPPGPARPHRGG